MKVVLQRVSRASVTVEGRVIGEIGSGLLLLVGFTESDTPAVLDWVARKVVGLRLFEDEEGRMNRSLEDVGGGVLVVSQFTLYGDIQKGRRPSFTNAAAPGVAEPLYDRFLSVLREIAPGAVGSGEFGAMMEVSLVNHGPVTLVIERTTT